MFASTGTVVGMTRAVFVSGGYVYSGAGGSLGIFIDAGADSVLVSRIRVTDIIEDIFVAGSNAYLAAGESGLIVVDVTVPSNPGTPIQIDTPNHAKGVHVVGNYAYVADTNAILAIDVSDPGSPSTDSTLSTYAYELQIVGDYLYYAGSGELGIVDVSTPGTLGTKYEKETSQSADGVAVAGNYAYLSHNYALTGLIIVDVTNPTAPGNLYTHTTSGNDFSVTVAGDHAYVGSTNARYLSVDVTDPTSPSDETIIQPGQDGWPFGDAGNISGWGYKSAVSGNTLYTAVANGLWSVDISNPATPGTPALIDFGGNAVGIAASGDYIYYQGWLISKLVSVDVSNPALSIPAGSAQANASQFGGAFATADHLYLARRGNGYAIADISDPTAPDLGSARDAGPDTRSLWVEGNYLYTASGSGLGVVDVTDPSTPGTISYTAAGGNGYDVQIESGFAFLTTDANQLEIFDVSVPTAPAAETPVALTAFPLGLDIDGGYAFMASSTADMELIAVDISNVAAPGTPVYVDLDQNNCYDVVVYRGHAFVKCEKALAIVDMTNPQSPGTVRTRPLAGNLFFDNLQQLIAHDGRIFVADYDNGVEIFEVFGLI